MKTKDIVTDDLVDKLAVGYAENSMEHGADWRALKIAMIAVAEITASQIGQPLQGGILNDDGTWT